jgi:hypothetical protein
MSVLGHFQKSAVVSARSVLPPGTDIVSRTGYVRKVHKRTHAPQQITSYRITWPAAASAASFDQLVGLGNQRLWHRETERLCCLQVDD